ncbi:FAD-binding monooxygenase [Flavobacterium rivuli WB 3.3-2 = DSM 21788]|uniref:FAD-binding monooxygenase n=1 Tax=Flavobacterium rivuli WB 3.3-2 = DSM 21788 TaxID=1121895 RepID=A0A0A2M0T8_9FLAO|nr:FAD-dependent monooxygenase [Flavobacterium rivuli]KGO85894.1 FAD-binding monooxygenase [Flavobacterium rivuli WB 3.3-2 = DSM 21788]
MNKKKILITGASVAGNTVAWWLSLQGFEVTVVERADSFRDGGQNVDVRGLGREVLRRMGLEEAALALNTSEQGTDWVDEDDTVLARFAVEDIGAEGPTAEMEILRGDLSRLIYNPASERAIYCFGDSIAAIEQNDSRAVVTFTSGKREQYDIVIVAEGVGSATRELVFPGENRKRYMDLTIAYFAIPGEKSDSKFARQYNTVGGRGATLKPGSDGKLRAYVGIHKKPEGENKWNTQQQKDFIRKNFEHDGWEFPRILKGMAETEDFYFDVLRQVRMKRWSKGRTVLTGDAAWCPTPLSGVGTTLAIVGGYVLAGEIARAEHYNDAFQAYSRIMRPLITEGQSFPKIGIRLLWPHTRFGLSFLRGAMRVAGKPSVRKIFSKLYLRDSKKIDLPDYNLINKV